MRFSYSDFLSQVPAEYLRTYFISVGAAALILIIAKWRVFAKAYEKGWKALIPIYNLYLYMKIMWEGSKFWIVFLGTIPVSILIAILAALGGVGAIIALVVELAWTVCLLYIVFKMAIKGAHRFGKSTAFGVFGLVFFSFIGLLILAFGSADYDYSRDP